MSPPGPKASGVPEPIRRQGADVVPAGRHDIDGAIVVARRTPAFHPDAVLPVHLQAVQHRHLVGKGAPLHSLPINLDGQVRIGCAFKHPRFGFAVALAFGLPDRIVDRERPFDAMYPMEWTPPPGGIAMCQDGLSDRRPSEGGGIQWKRLAPSGSILAKRGSQVHGAKVDGSVGVPQEAEPGEAAELSRLAAALRHGAATPGSPRSRIAIGDVNVPQGTTSL